MRITIDTRVDSAEDIRKAIAFLSSLNSSSSRIERQPANIFDSPSSSIESSSQPSPAPTESFMNMFGSSGSSPSSETESSYSSDNEEQADEKVEIIPY